MYLHFKETFPFNPKKIPFFYGYIIAVCSILGFLMSAPGQTIGVSVFTDSLIASLGLTRLQLSLAYTLGTIGSSLIITHIGRLLDTVGTRLVMTITSVLFGLALFYMSQVDRIAHFLSAGATGTVSMIIVMTTIILGFLSIRFFGQGILSLGSRTLLMRWFSELRGRINSVSGVFTGLMFSASPLMFEVLINRFTWRGAWLFMGSLIGMGFTLFVFLFFRNTPESCGMVPDGGYRSKKKTGPVDDEINWTLPETRRTFTFWAFNLGLSMFSMFYTAITFHIVSIFAGAGLPRHEAISVFLPSSFIAVGLTIVSGFLVDMDLFKYRLKYLLMFMISGLIMAGVGVLLLGTSYGKFFIILGNGISNGLFGNVTAVVWPRYYGRMHLGAINGYNMSYLIFFSAIGPSIFGWSFSLSGHYNIAVWVCIAVMTTLMLACLRADRPEYMVNPAEAH